MSSRRPTRKTGLPKPRLPADQKELQRTIDGLIERLEVLDGLRGDELDRAVTFRSLQDSGFDVSVPFAGGNPQVDGNPGGGGGGGVPVPTPGPTTPPTNLAANETFLAILLTWTNPSFNLQYIEVYRAATDNLSSAVLIGTTVAPFYVDYVGGSESYYYWVRAVGTDGSVTAYNDTAGTLGTTGVDPSDFEVELNISASNLVTALSDRIDLIDVGASSILNRLTATEGDITSIDGRTTTLEADYTTLNTAVGANTTGRTANASAITSLTTRVTTTESDITGLTTSVSSNTTSILDLEAAIGTIDAGGGEEWSFDTTTESWTATNATLTASGSGTVTWTPTASDPQLTSPTFSRQGSIYSQVIMRVRRTSAGGTWQGDLFYTTSGHGFSTSHYKRIADPSLVLNEWTVLTWDMTDLTAGGTDWVDNTITDLEFELVSDSAGVFEIDYVLVAKFSTTALSSAIEALDVRVSDNETDITANASDITALESTVNNGTTGVAANATAISTLQTNVSSNDTDISANATAITALETTVNDGSTGVAALASAISTLETTVNDGTDGVSASATAIDQLLARLDSGFANLVNPLSVAGDNSNTTYTTGEIQSGTTDGRSYTGAVVATGGNSQELLYRAGVQGTVRPIYVPDDAIMEVRFTVYHDRPNNAGHFYAGIYAYAGDAISTVQNVNEINGSGTLLGLTNNPYAIIFAGANGANTWYEIRYHVLGKNVQSSRCPPSLVNGSETTPAGWSRKYNGIKLTTNYFAPRFLNYNSSPTYGDGNTTTLIVHDLSVKRVDSEVDQYAALQTESSVRATETGDLQALYSVKAELASGGQPYVTGFGLAADLIDGNPTSAFTILADQFIVAAPGFDTAPGNANNSQAPFIVGNVGGVSTVAVNGQLIVDGSIRGTSIFANTIGADKINVSSLSALSADLGTVTAGLFRTAASPGFRVEIEDQASTNFPFWYGSGAKADAGGLFYVDESGDVVMRGKLDAGLIRASHFEASASNATFRIATQPEQYSGGNYTGKSAHFAPIRYANYQYQGTDPNGFLVPFSGASWVSDTMTFYGPDNTATNQYGRVGSPSETFLVFFSYNIIGASYTAGQAVVRYRYNNGTWRSAFTSFSRVNDSTAPSHMEVFVSDTTTWNTLDFRLEIFRPLSVPGGQTGGGLWLRSASVVIWTPNFGYADLTTSGNTTGSTSTTGGTIVSNLPRVFVP